MADPAPEGCNARHIKLFAPFLVAFLASTLAVAAWTVATAAASTVEVQRETRELREKVHAVELDQAGLAPALQAIDDRLGRIERKLP